MDRKAELIHRRSQLSEAQKALLAERLQRSLQGKTASALFPKRTPEQKNLLSFAQQRLWFLDQLAPGNPFYNIPLLIGLDGPLNVSVLWRSVAELIMRHDALRTNFVINDDEPLQVIAAADRVSPVVIDLRGLANPKRQQTQEWLARDEAQRPFDLACDPLVRYCLLRLEPQKHLLLITVHHIISDGWSLAILYNELIALYDAFLHGEVSPLARLHLQYVDYALWQRSWFQHEVLPAQLAYWRQQLANMTPLELPTDHPRPPVQTLQSASLRFTLPLDLISNMHMFCKQQGITPFVLLLAVFQTLLARYTDQDDIAIGTPISGRTRVELESLVGFFVNTLVIRTKLAGNPSLREILQRVEQTVSDAFNHQDLPFERLVEELQPERNMSQAPLIQTLFTLKVPVTTDRQVGELRLHSEEQPSEASQFDLMLTLSEEEGTLEYSTDLFEASTMRWFIRAYETLLVAFITTPEQSLNKLSLLGEAERQQVLVEWNKTTVWPTRAPAVSCLHHAFEAQVKRTPDAVALICEDHFLTYEELNCRSNRVAHYLLHLGVTLGKRVGIFLERSLEAIIGMLGTLKAEATYIPLDPAYPQERLAFMITSASIHVLLSCEYLHSQIPPGSIPIVSLDTDASVLARESAANPQSIDSGEHLAYIIFTSGTTGQPKGAGVYHQGFMNLLQWYISEFAISAQDRGSVITSLSFDLTQKNLFAPLLVGGLVCLHASPYHDVSFLLQWIEERTITLVNCTPSMFYPFMDEHARLHQLQSLRWLFLGGEPIAVRRFQPWLSRADCATEIVNTYGPTECSDVVAFYRLTHPERFLEATPPLGKPIAHTQLLILDKHFQPVPPIVPGELYIAGICVGAGYINDKLLTAEKLLSNPFPEIPGTCLYRTGDLARYLPDGLIEYLGRADQQVKIRGFRVELGEIEAIFEQHPGVQACVMHVWIDEDGEKHLVAYIIPGQPASLAEFRAYLRSRLPDYMVPAFFITLDAFPLTPSGKVDRRALPIPDQSAHGREKTLRVARTPIEEVVTDIYREILKIEMVTLEDNFFELGGHSLLATRVISRLRTLLQVDMPLRSLFEAPIAADFVRRIEQTMRRKQNGTRPALLPIDRSQELPLSFAQQRIWFLQQLASEASTYVLPVVLKIQGELNIAVLEKCLQEIVHRHESLRTIFIDCSGRLVQKVQANLQLSLEMVQIPSAEPHSGLAYVASEIIRRMEQPFDLQTVPVFRAGFFRLQEHEHIVFLLFHHIIFDGWSVGVLLHELSVLYAAFLQSQLSPLPPLPVQYADFACWQRSWLQGEVLTKLTHYWEEQLRGAQAVKLSKAQTEPQHVTNRGAASAFILSESLSQDLMALSRREGVTLFTTLLTAYQLLLYRATGQPDVLVGTDIANRTCEETESMIGFFVNLLPLRTQFRAQETFADALKRVRTTVLNAYAHQELPFEKIVEVLQFERTGRETPLINVLFVWQNVPLPPLRFQGLELSLLEEASEVHTTKFDLGLFMVETRGVLRGLFNYRTDLFSSEEIASLSSHFTILLQSIIATPDKAIEALEMFTKEEQEQQLSREKLQQEGRRHKIKIARREMLALPEKDGN